MGQTSKPSLHHHPHSAATPKLRDKTVCNKSWNSRRMLVRWGSLGVLLVGSTKPPIRGYKRTETIQPGPSALGSLQPMVSSDSSLQPQLQMRVGPSQVPAKPDGRTSALGIPSGLSSLLFHSALFIPSGPPLLALKRTVLLTMAGSFYSTRDPHHVSPGLTVGT